MLSISRRAWLFGAAAPFALRGQTCAPPTPGVPQAFVPTAGIANIQRLSISSVAANPAQLARLSLAFDRLRALTTTDPTDPRAWMQQANVHCFNCDGSAREIHGTPYFLPWHRAYIYFLERILCQLLADTTFRLPYWDWDLPASRFLPATYRAPMPNSLLNTTRSAAANSGGAISASLFPSVGSPQNPMNNSQFLLFSQSLEAGLHGAIHVWTGGSGPIATRGDMSILARAARDPIFYSHHGNIDRLWAEWNRRGRLNPTSSTFRNRQFLFYDENKVWRSIKVSQLLNTAPLGFSYPAGAALSAPAKPKTLKLRLDNTRTIRMKDAQRQAFASATLAKTRTLVLEEVALPAETGIYHIFAGDPPAVGVDVATAPNYLGFMAPLRGEHTTPRTTALSLDYNQLFVDQAASPGGVKLTFRPAEGGSGNALTFKKVFFLEE